MVKLFSKNSNLCDHNSPTLQTDRQTDGRTDRQTTCDRNTALCTKVHRAVIRPTCGPTNFKSSHVRYLRRDFSILNNLNNLNMFVLGLTWLTFSSNTNMLSHFPVNLTTSFRRRAAVHYIIIGLSSDIRLVRRADV